GASRLSCDEGGRDEPGPQPCILANTSGVAAAVRAARWRCARAERRDRLRCAGNRRRASQRRWREAADDFGLRRYAGRRELLPEQGTGSPGKPYLGRPADERRLEWAMVIGWGWGLRRQCE